MLTATTRGPFGRSNFRSRILVEFCLVTSHIFGSMDMSINKIVVFGLMSNPKRLSNYRCIHKNALFGVVYGLVESSVPFFFNEAGQNVTVNGERYRTMITDFVLPEIVARDVGDI